jgi:hypothetical protein
LVCDQDYHDDDDTDVVDVDAASRYLLSFVVFIAVDLLRRGNSTRKRKRMGRLLDDDDDEKTKPLFL